MNNKILKVVKNPLWIFVILNNKGLHLLNDKQYIKLTYRLYLNRKLDLDNVNNFNEKLQWIKLYDRNPQYTNMVDKYEAKKYVSNKIGKEYIIPTLGIYDNFEEIKFNELPDEFVIKCTHDSGNVFICKNKSEFDIEKTKKKINKLLKRNFFYYAREWPYKNVKPRIIIEKYMKDDGETLNDYKFFCCSGKMQLCLVCSDRFEIFKKTWFDREFNKLDITEGDHPTDNNIKKPKNYKTMIELAEKLSKGIPFLRVDFYEIGEKIFFGELTFFPSSGWEKFNPEKWNDILGEHINLHKLN